MRRPLALPILPLLAALAPLAGCGRAPVEPPESYERTQPWDAETLELFGSLPVQDSGRVKPLETFAGFRMLRMNGRRKLKNAAGEELGPSGWLLDVLFFPEQASTYPHFLVQNDAVLTTIGLEPKGKRDRYSYEELHPGLNRLFEQARAVPAEPKDRDTIQRQLHKLAGDVHEYQLLAHALAFARTTYATDGSPGLVDVFGESPRPGLAHVLARVPELMTAFRTTAGGLSKERQQEELRAINALSEELDITMRSGAGALPLFPPSRGVEEAPDWFVPTELARHVYEGEPVSQQVELLATLERMAIVRGDREAFRTELAAFHGGIQELAEARGEYGKVELETAYYGANYFTNALALFLLGFLAVAGSWLLPKARWPRGLTWGATGLGCGVAVTGVVVRCIIRGRPPVSTLYETILFITAVAVIVALAIEWINRERIALAVAPILGAMGMFLAGRYELRAANTDGDTMTSLIAVLDTNFWLATHVTSITIGYAAGLLAAAIAHVWILGKAFGIKRGDDAFYRSVVRMIYGVICFGLFFSVVGTILGGIWANYSWGRFWGWDPKENGALLICLWEIIIIHARLGGYVRQRGMAVMAVVGGVVVAFSWWGVNLLSVGLHSYGFTDGVAATLNIFYTTQVLVISTAFGSGMMRRLGKAFRALVE